MMIQNSKTSVTMRAASLLSYKSNKKIKDKLDYYLQKQSFQIFFGTTTRQLSK